MTTRNHTASPETLRDIPLYDVARTRLAPGMALVEASAGTGKTFNIAMSVVRLLLEGSTPADRLVGGIGNILVVTFTNAATEELVTRIRDLLQLAHAVYQGPVPNESSSTVQLLRTLADGREDLARARIAEARAAVDSLAVFTIHGFCKRVLEEFALESGTPFGASLVEDDAALQQEALADWWRRTFYTDAPLAAYAAARGWSPEVFLKDYRTWQRFPDATLAPAEPLAPARARVAQVAVSDAVLELATRLCLQLGTDGLRGELTLMRAARALAALDGAAAVDALHLRRVAPSALRHRLRRSVLDDTGSGTRVERAVGEVLGAA